MTRFSLPRTTVFARLRLTAGDELPGTVFTSDRVPQHEGPETVLELLNRPEPFFAYRPDKVERVLLIAKAHTVSLSVAEPLFADPARREAARWVDMDVVLAGGATLHGRAIFEQPDFHQRLLDFLNATRETFFAVTEDGTTHYVNRAHVLFARPRD